MLEIEDQNVEPGTIIQEIQPGYTMGERLLRPSFVGIAKKYEDKSVKKEEEKGD
jgi:molecular chaperone GrpE